MDDDVSTTLPKPPPPRPARREAAIAEALRRFDARNGGAAPAPSAALRRTAAPWWSGLARPQLAAFATVALVAAIGVPLWMSGDHRFAEPPRSAAVAPQTAEPHTPRVARAPSGALAAREVNADRAMAPSQPAQTAKPARAMASELPAPPPVAAPAPVAEPLPPAPAPVMAPPPPPPPVEAPAPSPSAAVAARVGRPATALANGARDDRALGEDIVVTAQRRSGAATERDDWDACTVNDPRQDLAACARHTKANRAGRAGRAGALVAEGLTQAWQRDPDRAIAAFDQAIALSPHLATAYLNRGLSYAEKGDTAKALADLDQAVRYAPWSARAYYQRSQLLRQKGDTRRADADLARATDPRNDAPIP